MMSEYLKKLEKWHEEYKQEIKEINKKITLLKHESELKYQFMLEIADRINEYKQDEFEMTCKSCASYKEECCGCKNINTSCDDCEDRRLFSPKGGCNSEINI